MNNNDFKKKWENYWYHYKARTWVIVFVVLALLYTVFEYTTTDRNDLNITYIGKYADYKGIAKELEKNYNALIEDVDKNGELTVGAYSLLVTSEHVEGDAAFWQRVDINFLNGESYLYFVDKSVYEHLKKRNSIGKIKTSEGNTLFLDVSDNEYFKPYIKNGEPLYLCVRNSSLSEKDGKVYKMEQNSRKILEKILEKY